ncbi:MAG: PD-(D/E)XK nuclease family protein [Verrucomicrobiota bacterium]|nr:PD-(D/E)XK nuclease family protein [Verrucomicrobiota bacterium]
MQFCAQLLEQRISLLGIRFFAPAQLREHLLAESELPLPLREHLRLLLAIAAENYAREKADGPTSVARAIARAPDHLLRAIDQVGAAGWNFSDVSSGETREIVDRFERLIGASGFSQIEVADRAAHTSPFTNLLIAGFDGTHWPDWPLLVRAAKSAKKATVILVDPRDEARDLDATWIGSWEQEFGVAGPLQGELEQLTLFGANGAGARVDPGVAPGVFHFLVGRDTSEEAQAIAAMTAQFLAEGRGRRIGLLFPEAGALPRLVAAALERADIAHHDAISHYAPGPFEENAWSAWLELQGSQRLKPVLNFVAAHPRALAAFRGLTSRQVEKHLRRALDDTLIDDLDVLREFCRRNDRERDAQIADGLGTLRILPPTATLSEFLEMTREAFDELGWTERSVEVQRLSGGWSEKVPIRFPRAIFLRWLAEVTSSFARVRSEIGNHPYSRVQLLRYPQAAEQSWSHLIFCGLNEGAWPPRARAAAFVADEELGELNSRARVLNSRALQQGNQGDGHTTVAAGKALFLDAADQRDIAARQFSALLESVAVGIAFAANLFDETAPGRMANPSEFFTRQYFLARGEALSQSTFAALREQTRGWLEPFAETERTAPTAPDVLQTRVAYDSRRGATAAGEYDFSLRTPLAKRRVISATAWERALTAPAQVWLKAFLGVEPENDDERSALATGQWVHRWLASISRADAQNQFVPFPRDLLRRVRDEAAGFRADVAMLLESCGRQTPDWWLSGWSKAAYLADCFARKVAALGSWTELATEWRLDDAQIMIDPAAALTFNGRVDLILARGAPDSTARELWVVDYKTGTRKTLRPTRCKTDEKLTEKLERKLRCGEGVQLALYALALRGGDGTVAVSLLSPNLPLDRPQLLVDEITAQKSFWRELASMQATGVFGMRGPIRSDFSFHGAYPLATLAIDPDLLETKWAKTHPVFARNSEEAEE